MALLLDKHEKPAAPNTSFSTSLKALGADDVIRIFRRALQPPDDVVVNKDKPTLNLRQQTTDAMTFLGFGDTSNEKMRRASIRVFVDDRNGHGENDSLISEVSTKVINDVSDIDMFSEAAFPIAPDTTHQMSVTIANNPNPPFKSEKEMIIALLVYVGEFFSTDKLDAWLPEIVNTVSVSNAYMINLIHAELPNFVEALRKVIFVDRVRVLQDSLSIHDIKTVHVSLPIRVDNLKHEGYPILHKIVKSWLGDISFELLEEGSREGSTNLRVAGLRFDHRLATWEGVGIKRGRSIIWHRSEFSNDKVLDGIKQLLATPPTSYRQTVKPVEFTVGSKFVLKAHLAFRLFGLVPIPPCTLWIDVCICEYGELYFKLADFTGVVGQAARFIMPSTLNLIMSTCTFKIKLSDGCHEKLKNEYSTVIKEGVKQPEKDKTSENAKMEEITSDTKDEQMPTSSSGLCTSPSSSAVSLRVRQKGTQSIILCGFAKGRAKSMLSWVVSLIWAKVVASGAIFEIWLLVFNLFSGMLLDLVELSKTIESTDTSNVSDNDAYDGRDGDNNSNSDGTSGP